MVFFIQKNIFKRGNLVYKSLIEISKNKYKIPKTGDMKADVVIYLSRKLLKNFGGGSDRTA